MHGLLSLVRKQKDTEQIAGFKNVSQGCNSADIILIFPNKLGLGPETLSRARGPNIFQEPYFNHRIFIATELLGLHS